MHKDGIPVKSSLDKKVAVEVREIANIWTVVILSILCSTPVWPPTSPGRQSQVSGILTRRTLSYTSGQLQSIKRSDQRVSELSFFFILSEL